MLIRIAAAMACALSLSVAGMAQETDTRLMLWNGLRLGMTKDEVKQLLPKRLVPLGNGCHIVAYARYEAGKLHRIDMEWSVNDPPAKRCGILVRQALREKYGEPDASEREIKDNDCGNPYARGLAGALSQLCSATGGDEPDYYELARWHRDGVEISFKLDVKADDPQWWAVYRATPFVDEGMKAKF